DPQAGTLARLYETLSADERQRAAGFRFERHRSRFIASRGFLRLILGAYLGMLPEAVKFTYGLNGEPGMDGDRVQFNASHSEDRALYAIALDAPIGVDLEWMRPSLDFDQIARSFFSPVEWAEYRVIPPDRQTEAFFRCWTRKEAFIKATGLGL